MPVFLRTLVAFFFSMYVQVRMGEQNASNVATTTTVTTTNDGYIQ